MDTRWNFIFKGVAIQVLQNGFLNAKWIKWMPIMHGSLCYDHERLKNTTIIIHKIPKTPTKSMDSFTNTRNKFHKPHTPTSMDRKPHIKKLVHIFFQIHKSTIHNRHVHWIHHDPLNIISIFNNILFLLCWQCSICFNWTICGHWSHSIQPPWPLTHKKNWKMMVKCVHFHNSIVS